MECECTCGETNFKVNAVPIMRTYCHCTICQKYNEAAFADVVVFRKKEIEMVDLDKIAFQAYKKPPAVQRGKCKNCEQPVLEFFSAPLFPSLAMVPIGMFADDVTLPQASMHMFYEHKIDEHADGLPKHNGFIRSQAAFMKTMIKGLLNRN